MSNHARDETRQPEHEKEKEVVTAEVSDGGEEEQVVMVAEDGAGAGVWVVAQWRSWRRRAAFLSSSPSKGLQCNLTDLT